MYLEENRSVDQLLRDQELESLIRFDLFSTAVEEKAELVAEIKQLESSLPAIDPEVYKLVDEPMLTTLFDQLHKMHPKVPEFNVSERQIADMVAKIKRGDGLAFKVNGREYHSIDAIIDAAGAINVVPFDRSKYSKVFPVIQLRLFYP